ncbi:tyrosine-type recombinase/integrase [Afipia birgiae]|uniref:tyrosine-type recombinase/integrase n=1 Tax=Afipia birgiae TaxID=151414 RepID=UPI00031F4F35|nr:site-specific integrase [Afipia birgiae]
MPEKLTAITVTNAQRKSGRYEIADSEQPGLRLIIQPSGVKSWAFRYERSDGTTKRVSLGRAAGPGALTLVQARNAANDANRQRTTGGDPADAKRAERAAQAARIKTAELEARRKDDTVEKVLARYYTDHVDGLKSGDEVKRVLNREMKSWAKRRVDDIQRRDAIKLLDTLKARAPVQSNRLRAYGRHFFGWCISKELASINPFDGTKAAKEISRDRVLTDDELRLLLRAIDRLDWPRKHFVHMLLLSAQRLTEVKEMDWRELDLTSATPMWTLPRSRSKNGRAHTVPLAPVAVSLLAGMDRLTDSTRVFAPFSESHAKLGVDAAMLDIAREDAAARSAYDPDSVMLVPWGFHDLRRTAATTMARLGVDVVIVERILGHTMRGVMAVYQRHTFDEEKRRGLTVWAGFLDGLTSERESNVVSINAGTA